MDEACRFCTSVTEPSVPSVHVISVDFNESVSWGALTNPQVCKSEAPRSHALLIKKGRTTTLVPFAPVLAAPLDVRRLDVVAIHHDVQLRN
jgi:hypothetical protein